MRTRAMREDVEKGAALFKDVKTIPVSFGLVF